ncbi:MAG: hypothetical protein Q4B40_04425 [Clostridia bacterium]|nr:hypothetical protein [Clostridia bacterium]
MSEKTIEKSIKNASASLKIEGYSIDEQAKTWCRQLLNGEITMQEYIILAKQKAGVSM